MESIQKILGVVEVENQEIVNKTLYPAVGLGDIATDLTSEALVCGFRTIEECQYLRASKPDLAIVAARPGVGKTAFLLQVAKNVAEHSNVLFYSLEMSKEQLKTRLVAGELGASVRGLAFKDPNKLRAVEASLGRLKLKIDDTSGLSINVLKSRAIGMHQETPFALIVVDYSQIVQVETRRTKTEEVAYVVEQLKDLAKKLNCPVLAAAQMNRNAEQRITESGDLRPMMSDLADSAGIEKWADQIMFLHRPSLYGDTTRMGEVDVFVVKNRHGDMGEFTLGFTGSSCSFTDLGQKAGI